MYALLLDAFLFAQTCLNMPDSTYKKSADSGWKTNLCFSCGNSNGCPLYLKLILMLLQEDYSHIPLYLILASTIVYFVLPCAIVTVLYIR